MDDLRARALASKAGKERRRWAAHLGVTEEELLSFFAQVTWRHADSEPDWDERARLFMHQAGLRTDNEAVTIGKALVRSWVTSGSGPQTRDDIRRQVADKNLLARAGTLSLAVHAIDHQPAATPANVELDFTALFEGDTPFARRQLKDPSDWRQVIMPELARAARTRGQGTGVGRAGLPPQARVHRRPAEHRVCRAAAKPCPRASSPSCGTGPRYQPACRPTSRPHTRRQSPRFLPIRPLAPILCVR